MKRIRENPNQNTSHSMGCMPFFLIFIIIFVIGVYSSPKIKKDINYFVRGDSDITKFISQVKTSYNENMTYPDFISPLNGTVTSPFGERISPITNKKENHTGIDIDINKGTNILASADGEIFKVAVDERFGNYIIIKHNNIFQTCYAHLQSPKVQEGAIVKKGDIIGIAGDTGLVTGKHLHFEIRKKDERVNPQKYIKVGVATN